MDTDQNSAGAHETAPPAIDPVCGMVVDPTLSPFASKRGRQTIWFCCAGCKKAFDRKPGLYGQIAATEHEPARAQ